MISRLTTAQVHRPWIPIEFRQSGQKPDNISLASMERQADNRLGSSTRMAGSLLTSRLDGLSTGSPDCPSTSVPNKKNGTT